MNDFLVGLIILLGLLILVCLSLLCVLLIRAYSELNRSANNAQHLLFTLRKWDSRDEQQEKYIEKKLNNMHYRKIAVYGCGVLGKRMARNLENSDIKIEYFIDRDTTVCYKNIQVIHNMEDLPQVDAVIVTVVSQFYLIRESLHSKIRCPIISVEDLL